MRAELETWLHAQWAKRGLAAWLLSPLSLIYLAAVRMRAHSIRAEKHPVAV